MLEESLIASIRERHLRVLERITAVARHCGRDPQSVQLVVVTKAQPLVVVQAALAAGIRLLGENYPQEAVEKMTHLESKPEVEWHMIGHVQSRKAGLVAQHFTMLHSLDSLKLANRLDRILAAAGRSLPAMLEMNVSGEDTKFGWFAWEQERWSSLLKDIEQVLLLPNLVIKGLMAMPPYFELPERSRPYFRRLRRLRDFLASHFSNLEWSELSIGTSVDFEVAIEEGATFVRVGQAILGPRPA